MIAVYHRNYTVYAYNIYSLLSRYLNQSRRTWQFSIINTVWSNKRNICRLLARLKAFQDFCPFAGSLRPVSTRQETIVILFFFFSHLSKTRDAFVTCSRGSAWRARRHVNNISSLVFPCRCIFYTLWKKLALHSPERTHCGVVVVHRDIRLAGKNDRTQISERTHARLSRIVRRSSNAEPCVSSAIINCGKC